MNLALRRLLRKGDPSPEEVDAFVAESEFPLVDENNITFVFRGDADAVYLRCWISGLDAAQPFQSLGETDLWAATIELPKGSRIEYKFDVVRNGHGELILDPLNPVIARDPFGANSVCQAHGYERPEWTEVDPEARTGTVESTHVDSATFKETRETSVYLPARFRRLDHFIDR